MTKERLEKILDNILSWGNDHDEEFRECLINAMDLTDEEIKELQLEEYISENENDLDLPTEDEIARVDFDDLNEMDEYVSDYLSNEYGFCVKSFKYDFDTRKIYIYDIEWDTSE